MDQIKIPTNWNAKSSVRTGSLLLSATRRPISASKQFVEELKQNLQGRLAARRSKEAIRARARELWEASGCPPDRDLEFWLKAEEEFREAETH